MELTINLITSKFHKFNSDYFKGELTLNFEVKIADRMRSLGHVKSHRGKGVIYHFAISHDFDWTEEILDEVVMHEMIHVWQIQIDKKSKGHDYGFQRKMRELRSASGIQISQTGRLKSPKIRRCRFLYIKIEDRYHITFTSDKNFAYFISSWESYAAEKKATITSGYIDLPSEFEIKRSPNRFYNLPESRFKELNFVDIENEPINNKKKELKMKSSPCMFFKEGKNYKIVFMNALNCQKFGPQLIGKAYESNSTLSTGVCELPIGFSVQRNLKKCYSIPIADFNKIVFLELDKDNRGAIDTRVDIGNDLQVAYCTNGAYLTKNDIEHTVFPIDVILRMDDIVNKDDIKVADYINSFGVDHLKNLFPKLAEKYNLEEFSNCLFSKIAFIYEDFTMKISLHLHSKDSEIQVENIDLSISDPNFIQIHKHAA